jgi:4'-phosphopantetheinyl transferase
MASIVASSDTMTSLHPDRAVVHWATPEDWTAGADRDAIVATLSDEERARLAAFRFPRDQALFLTAHGLLRQVLGDHTGHSAGELRFERGEHGRPELTGALRDTVRFNLSHTEGLVAVVLHPFADCGVDVERIGRRTNVLKVADRFFSPQEVTELHAQPMDRQRRRFFELWTLKEAYIKARGMGLALPLRRFSFQLDAPGPIHFVCAPEVDGRPRDWWFHQQPLGEDHLLAVAIRCPAGDAMNLEVRQTPWRPV